MKMSESKIENNNMSKIYKMNYTETINLENAKKASLMEYEDYLFKFKAKEWEDEDGKKCSSKSYFERIKNWLKKVVKRNKATYITKYKYSKNQLNGRIYVRGMGIQSVPCMLKCYLLEGIECNDYDMKNAHYTILQYIIKKNNLKVSTKYLDNYVKYRTSILEKNKLSKMDYILALFNDNCINPKLKVFHKELSIIKKKINEKEKHNINDISNLSKKNPISSLLSKILGYYENEILQEVMSKYESYIPYYDGFIGEKNIDIKDIDKITEKYGVKWAIKSLKNDVNLDDINITIPQLCQETKTFFMESSHYNYAEYYINKLLKNKGKYFFIQGDKYGIWYEYNEHNILNCSKSVPLSLIKDITVKYQNMLRDIVGKANDHYDIMSEELATYMKYFSKINKVIGSCCFQKNIVEQIKTMILVDNNVVEKIDQNNNIIAFKNQLYDFEKEEFRKIEKSDFIMNHLDYECPEEDLEVQKDINKIVDSIFDEKDLKKYFWDSLSFSLFTNRFEKFNIWTGKGSNGKGILLKLLEKSFGSYMKQPNSQFLTSSIEGANSSLVQCRGKKLVMVSEPENDKNGNLKFNTNFIKKLTGRDTISGRALFQDEISFKPNFNLFCQCNEIPEIESVDNAIQRRFVILPFKNKFVMKDDLEKYEGQKNIKIADPMLKDKIDNDENLAYQFMLMLIKKSKGNFKKDLIIPKNIQDTVKEYISSNDVVNEFVNECYEFSDDKKALIKFTELYNEFKGWGGFNGMKKKQFKYNLLLINGVCEKRTSNGRFIKGFKFKVDNDMQEDFIEDEDELDL
jgi:P4 family phage/plasmid primase-like protien